VAAEALEKGGHGENAEHQRRANSPSV